MSHQTIIFRLGASDSALVAPSRPDSIVTDVPFLDPYDKPMYGVDHPLDQLREWGFNPSEIGVELIMLATALTAADTRISRGAHSQDGWSREIDLHLPVSDVARWSSQAMLLQTMLRFLTGDRWQLFFRPRPTDAPSLVRPTEKLRMFEPSCVCLFSGGLDSFIGATNLLARREAPMLVSHWWDPNASKHQTNCIEALAARFAPQELHHVRAQIGFDHDTLAQSSREDTLRGRSFLFFALAAATASAVGGVVTVYVPENGLISLNVPLDPLRVGALSTRTTHPFYMARFNELLQGLGIPAQLENPHRHQTKGEMVDSCLEKDFLHTSAKLTMSCSAEGKHRHDRDEARRKVQHCGHCVPCLIRRAALHAGFGSDDTEYWLKDLHAQAIDSSTAMGEHIRAFQFALARLAAHPGRARRDIHQPGPLYDHPDDLDDYEGVYVRGMQEVAELLEDVEARPIKDG
ncbi:Qat anti-phage system QueC-like protein QatC [Variovorax sp. LT1R20]|uniref:Qat anti-phage system QueC-like protein QatC n=1 Tax=Variovorax sp. LT1R20 TaxID=3443729 RepID=UPI003F47AD78